MERSAIERWVAEYFRCWRAKDGSALARLFTETAIYRSGPFREPLRGREGIRSYWEEATRSQVGIRLRSGTLVCEGAHASIEWWASWSEDGEPVTLPGCLFLRFSEDGLCEELREYWQAAKGAHDPPEGWGS